MFGKRKEPDTTPELKEKEPLIVDIVFYPTNTSDPICYEGAKLKYYGFGRAHFEYKGHEHYISGGSWYMRFRQEGRI